MTVLREWLAQPAAESFLLDAVVKEFRTCGKHFVSAELIADLAKARALLPEGTSPLRSFLNTALDKHDNRFDNPSYLALHDLPLPTTAGQCPLDTLPAERQRDRLMMLLVSDLLRFEIDAHHGRTVLLPLMRPDARVVLKRCTLGAIVLRSVMARMVAAG